MDFQRILEYKKTKDPRILEELVLNNSNLVFYWANKFLKSGEPIEDLIQVGYIGLIKAIKNYDPKKGQFSTYASYCIMGEISHYLRDRGSIIKFPKTIRKLFFEMESYIQEIFQKENRVPSIEEISKKLNLKKESVEELMKLRENFFVQSVDDEDFYIDWTKIRSERLESFQLPIEDKIQLEIAINSLPEIQRKIIYYIFYYDLTQSEVAKKLQISQAQVSKLLKIALKKLKEILTKEIF
ncbi:MAG: flagellar biosynthesis protein FliA [Dictyoglomus sp. NZ13-RE01]|nr:MAG: flagellar biosynthesis protein FliA [Dictyoglomus sp. NZ13-RE01]